MDTREYYALVKVENKGSSSAPILVPGSPVYYDAMPTYDSSKDTWFGTPLGEIPEFVNEKTDTSCAAVIRATKVLNKWGEDSYTFRLTRGTNTAAGSIETPMPEGASGDSITAEASKNRRTAIFGRIQYDQTGDYHYTIQEIIPTGANGNKYHYITYDTALHNVVVTVSESGGKMLAVVRYDGKNTLFIKNTYEAIGQTTLSATKKLFGRDFKSGDNWTFTVTADNGGPLPENTTVSISPASGNETQINFGQINFTEVDIGKTYTYTIKESGQVDKVVNGKDVTVTVSVTDNGDGSLTVTSSADTNPLVFNNVYGTSVDLTARKYWQNRTLKGGDCRFTLTEVDEQHNPLTGNDAYSETVTNDANGSVRFSTIPYMFDENSVGKEIYHYYRVEEVPGEDQNTVYSTNVYYVKVKVIFGQYYSYTEHTIEGGSHELYFENNALDNQIVLRGMKTLQGRTFTDGDTLSVTIQADDGGRLPNSSTITVPLEAGKTTASYEFAPIKYEMSDLGNEDSKTFTYTITETASMSGVTADTRAHKVVVTVTKVNGSALKAEAVYQNGTDTDARTEFLNVYSDTSPVSSTLAVTKKVNNAAPGSREFDFSATAASNNPTTGIDDSGFVSNPTNNPAGEVSFGTLMFSAADTWKYTVKETSTDGNGMTVDKSEYEVTFTVTQSSGALQVEKTVIKTKDASGANIHEVQGTSPIEFNNTYAPTGTVSFKAQKFFTGGTLAGNDFTFTLVEYTDGTFANRKTGGVSQSKKNDANGEVTFDDVTLTDTSTRYFIISETAGSDSNIVYDTHVQKITVTVIDNNGTLMPTKSYSAADHDDSYDAKFTNAKKGSLKITKNVTVNGGNTGTNAADGDYTFIIKKEGTAINYGKIAGTGTPVGSDGKVTVTIADGQSSTITVTELPAGEYTVEEQTTGLPTGVSLTSGIVNPQTITVVAGDTAATISPTTAI